MPTWIIAAAIHGSINRKRVSSASTTDPKSRTRTRRSGQSLRGYGRGPANARRRRRSGSLSLRGVIMTRLTNWTKESRTSTLAYQNTKTNARAVLHRALRPNDRRARPRSAHDFAITHPGRVLRVHRENRPTFQSQPGDGPDEVLATTARGGSDEMEVRDYRTRSIDSISFRYSLVTSRRDLTPSSSEPQKIIHKNSYLN